MRRREFVVLLGGAAVAGPVAGWAQPGKCRASACWCWAIWTPVLFLKEFREGLRELGYVEGQSIVFEFRSAAGDSSSSHSSPQNWSRSRSISSSPFRHRP